MCEYDARWKSILIYKPENIPNKNFYFCIAAATASVNHASQSHRSIDTVDQSLKTRLIVTLHDNDRCSELEKPSSEPVQQASRRLPDGRWECSTCTYLNTGGKNACEMCGKSRQIGVEALPLTSGGKECPACTLVNQRQATVCAACDTSLKHSPTYI